MLKNNLIAELNDSSDENIIGRIGGNIPEILLEQKKHTVDYKFYLSIEHPEKKGNYLTILVPDNYDTMIDNNIYPNCSIKVISHPISKESENIESGISQLNKMNIFGYIKSEHSDFITVTDKFNLIQNESYYYQGLIKDGYEPFLQIDEDFYPDGLLNGSYIFGYGALYLYKNTKTEEVIAGFWQYS